jgi:quinol monooxygenase YgiN
MSCYMVSEFYLEPEHGAGFPQMIRKNLIDVYKFEGFEGVLKTLRDQDNPNHFFVIERWRDRGAHEAYVTWRTERGERASASIFARPASVQYHDDADGEFLPTMD